MQVGNNGKGGFIVHFEGNWITSDDNIVKYISGNERSIYINTNIDFEVFVGKIYNHLKFDRSQANVHIVIVDDASMGPIEIKDDNDLEYIMIEAESL